MGLVPIGSRQDTEDTSWLQGGTGTLELQPSRVALPVALEGTGHVMDMCSATLENNGA